MLAHPAIPVASSNRDLDGRPMGIGTKMSPQRPSCPFRGVAAPRHRSHKPARALSTMASSTGCTSRRRPADDAEHLGRRRLMLQRLAQFRIALLQFLEQSNIFDGDNGLGGESFREV